jgi:hypothetical protein
MALRRDWRTYGVDPLNSNTCFAIWTMSPSFLLVKLCPAIASLTSQDRADVAVFMTPAIWHWINVDLTSNLRRCVVVSTLLAWETLGKVNEHCFHVSDVLIALAWVTLTQFGSAKVRVSSTRRHVSLYGPFLVHVISLHDELLTSISQWVMVRTILRYMT